MNLSKVDLELFNILGSEIVKNCSKGAIVKIVKDIENSTKKENSYDIISDYSEDGYWKNLYNISLEDYGNVSCINDFHNKMNYSRHISGDVFHFFKLIGHYPTLQTILRFFEKIPKTDFIITQISSEFINFYNRGNDYDDIFKFPLIKEKENIFLWDNDEKIKLCLFLRKFASNSNIVHPYDIADLKLLIKHAKNGSIETGLNSHNAIIQKFKLFSGDKAKCSDNIKMCLDYFKSVSIYKTSFNNLKGGDLIIFGDNVKFFGRYDEENIIFQDSKNRFLVTTEGEKLSLSIDRKKILTPNQINGLRVKFLAGFSGL